MISKIKKTIEDNLMLNLNDKVIVGLSGGADSMTLLNVLLNLKKDYQIDITAVHINHCIRGQEAIRDQLFVTNYCKDNNIKLKVFEKNIPLISKQTGESEEECGRRIRYECFSSISADCKIATAHTLSDSIETMIFNMLRGTSITGLCGIPAKRDNIIRPLISCTRKEIEEYCFENNIPYIIDSTNLNSNYSRNYIRNEIIPLFSKINPMYMQSLERCQNFLKADSLYIDNEVDLLYKKLISDGEKIPCKEILNLPTALKGRLLYKLIEDKTKISPENKHIMLAVSYLEKGGSVQLSKEYYLTVNNGFLYIDTKKSEQEEWKLEGKIGENNVPFGDIINISVHNIENIKFNEKLVNNTLVYYIDYDKIKGKLFIRSRKQGDKITLPNRGVTKSLKKLFTELKIPIEDRNKIPVISDEEKILCICGIGYNKHCEISKETKKVLKIVGGTK